MKTRTILLLSWRDIKSPGHGGAEVHTCNLTKSLEGQDYKFISFSPKYEGLAHKEIIDNVTYIRKGNIITVIIYAWLYYLKNREKIDFVINQCNTHNFFTRFWVPSKKRIFYIHQLTREIWDINAVFPINKIGRALENFSLRLNKNDYTITVSESTKRELVELGFNPDKIYLIYNAIDRDIVKNTIEDNKESNKDFIYVGRYSKYKGIDVAIEALGMVHEVYPDVKLRIVGKEDKEFTSSIIVPIARKYDMTVGHDDSADVVICGFVSEEDKLILMEKSKALLFPSIREGWGIIVSEAAARGTPSIVYNSPGARDAVDYGNAGFLCESNTIKDMSNLMLATIENEEKYVQMQENALKFVKNFSWEKNADTFNRMMKDKENSNK